MLIKKRRLLCLIFCVLSVMFIACGKNTVNMETEQKPDSAISSTVQPTISQDNTEVEETVTKPVLPVNNVVATETPKVNEKYANYNIENSMRNVYGDEKKYNEEMLEKDLEYLVYGNWKSYDDGSVITLSEKQIDGKEYTILDANMSFDYIPDFGMSTFYLSVQYEYKGESGTVHQLCLDSGILSIDYVLYEVCDRESPWDKYVRYNSINGLSATEAEGIVDSAFYGTWTASDGTDMTFDNLSIGGRIYQVIDVEEIVFNNYNVNMNIVYLDDPDTVHNVYYGSAGRLYVGDMEYSDKVVNNYDVNYDYSDSENDDWSNDASSSSADSGLSEEEMLNIAAAFITTAMSDTKYAGCSYEIKSVIGAEHYLGNTFTAKFKIKVPSAHYTGTLTIYIEEGFFGDYKYQKAKFY